jgi:hypothetical protein
MYWLYLCLELVTVAEPAGSFPFLLRFRTPVEDAEELTSRIIPEEVARIVRRDLGSSKSESSESELLRRSLSRSFLFRTSEIY